MALDMLNIYEPQVQAYVSTVEGESWKPDHDGAMRCLSVEDILILGNGLYDFLIEADERWRLEFATGATTVDLSEGFDVLFKLWLIPCKKVAGWIRECETSGFQVEGADEFRYRFSQAKSIQDDQA